jgi:hypothetical protein
MTDNEIIEIAIQSYSPKDDFTPGFKHDLIVFARLIAKRQQQLDVEIVGRYCVEGLHTACDAIRAAILAQGENE